MLLLVQPGDIFFLMGVPERKSRMESEKMKQPEESVTTEEVDSPKDQFAWAQYLHDAQFFDFSAFSPKGLITPRLDSPNSFPDLGAICPSPLFSDQQLKFLQSWSTSPKVTASSEPESAAVTVAPAPAPSVSDQMKMIQSLDLSRVSNSEPGVSTSVTTSCESEGPCSSSDVKLGANCAESTGSGDERSRTRKRKSVERDEAELENVDDASESEEMEDSKGRADKPPR